MENQYKSEKPITKKSHKVFNVPDDFRKELRDILRSISAQETYKWKWEYFDDSTMRLNISMLENINVYIKKIFELSGIDSKNYNGNLLHYIEYTIKESYEVDIHNDNCENTIIIFLEKDKDITDKFMVEFENVEEDYWKCGGMLMSGCPEHEVIINGSGKREVLCIFNGEY